MPNTCELCGKTDEDGTESVEAGLELLHVCAECLQARKPAEDPPKSW
jgi:ribosome-binding protein aMBF1 (putative translation factor)